MVWRRRFDRLRNQWSQPEFWLSTVPQFAWEQFRAHTTGSVARWYWYEYHQGCRLMEESWDTLLLLDAARADEVARLLEGTDWQCETRVSLGSATYEFAPNNFSDGPYLDTVYVTANPHIQRTVGDQFHQIVNVWKDAWTDPGTVHPEAMTQAVREAREEYPHKRIIGHFMQPHVPYIGETAATFPEAAQRASIQHTRDELLGQGDAADVPNALQLLEQGRLSRDQVLAAYRESLELAWEEIEGLLETLPGRTVVSADHGEAFGEFSIARLSRIYGHPDETPAKPLVEVPWIVESGDRMEIREGDRGSETVEGDVVEERLADLGYR